MRARVLYAAIACAAILAGGELWLRHALFQHVSYSNSVNIDHQIESRRSAPWRLIFVGDSEVRWGVDPASIDAAFGQSGVPMRSFNHAFDGFGASWWPQLLPSLLRDSSLRDVETVAVGVQMVDRHQTVSASGSNCGALQRPVLTSPMAVDLGVDYLCRTRTWDSQLGRDMFGFLWSVRYASAVRALLLPDAVFAPARLEMNSRKLSPPDRGFQAHHPIAQDRAAYEDEFRRWKMQFNPARDFGPLPESAWPDMVAPGGFFDELHASVKASGRNLALFALPTNPQVIDLFQRRADYARNAQLLSQWAKKRGVVFVDLGIHDRPDADEFFSDMRHLSGQGARVFSHQLGLALAKEGVALP